MNGNETFLIDSSVWISYYRPHDNKDLKIKVSEAIKNDSVAVCGLVKTEVLQGTANLQDFDLINDDFNAFHYFKMSDDYYERAARLAFKLRRKGFTVPVIDLLIAMIAIQNDLILWHQDNHYELIKNAEPLKSIFLKQ